MWNRIIIAGIIITILVTACDYSHNSMSSTGYDVLRIYKYDIDQGTREFISEGIFYPVFRNSDKFIYGSDGYWLYDIKSGESKKLDHLLSSHFDEVSVSPDNNNIVYCYGKSVYRYNILTTINEKIVELDENILSIPYAAYSPDGNQICFLSNPNMDDGRPNYDIIKINIYNISSREIVTVDTSFEKHNFRQYAGFSFDSKYIYFIQEGFNEGPYQIRVSLFENKPEPVFIKTNILRTFDYRNEIWNIGDYKFLILEASKIYKYDFVGNKLYTSSTYSGYRGAIRKLSGQNLLIAANQENKVNVMYTNGGIYKMFDTGISAKEQVYRVDYSEMNNCLIINTHGYFEN